MAKNKKTRAEPENQSLNKLVKKAIIICYEKLRDRRDVGFYNLCLV